MPDATRVLTSGNHAVLQHVVDRLDQSAQFCFEIVGDAVLNGGFAEQVAGFAQIILPLAHPRDPGAHLRAGVAADRAGVVAGKIPAVQRGDIVQPVDEVLRVP